jgi:putative ABC transport system permease protein
VLLIAAVNIANLLLSRAAVREREIAVRAAVGAGRMRVMRQLVTESLVLALGGGAAGLAVARLAIAALIRISPYAVPRLLETSIDTRTLAFALLVSVAAGLLFGAGPALVLWRANLHEALKAGARSSAGPRGLRLRRVLVGMELALAMVLLAGAGLMLKSFWRMNERPAGFTPEKVLVMRLNLAGPTYAGKPEKERYFRELVRRLDSAPGVEAAGIANWIGFIGELSFPNDPSPRRRVVRFTMGSSEYLREWELRWRESPWAWSPHSASRL